MAMGAKARDPNTPYEVYEFAVNGKVYYVGIGQANSKRATDRWNYVSKQIDRLNREGTLPPGKLRDIEKPSGAVIRRLIEMGIDGHKISYPWRGTGRGEALRQEALRIETLVAQDCRLANIDGNPFPASVDEILEYLNIK